jgi:AraC-like DNA-binding protein
MITPDLLRRLCRARDRLRETSEPDLPVPEISRESGLSTFHFIRLFAAVFGATPHRFRQRHRLELARQMLAFGNESVTEVCMSVGFSSLGSFSRLFRSRFGKSPQSYRQHLTSSASTPGDMAGRLQPGCLSLFVRAFQVESQFRRSNDDQSLRECRGEAAHGGSRCESS